VGAVGALIVGPGARPLCRRETDSSSHGLHHEAVLLRVVHLDRRHCVFQLGLPRCGRPGVGRALAVWSAQAVSWASSLW
jgi:hypothetical protein